MTDWVGDRQISRRMLVGDQEQTLYTIGALARATGKTKAALLRWVREGVIPDAGMRTPPLSGNLGNTGHRLWTQEQIEAIVEIGTATGALQAWPHSVAAFSARVHAVWAQKNW